MGAKSSSQDIRSNKDHAMIEGAFDLSERKDVLKKLEDMGIGFDDASLIVRRLLQKNGKSKVYLNGHLSTVSDLKKIVFPLVTISNPTEAPLVEITGQHENKDLMSLRYQMDVLDQFCGNLGLRSKINDIFDNMNELANKMTKLENLSKQREQQIDFLNFQINEIEELALEENEDEKLSLEIKDLKSKEQWQEWLHESIYRLNTADHAILSQIQSILKSTPDHSSLTKSKQQLEQSFSLLEDVAFNLQQLAHKDYGDSSSLDQLESRLSRIRKLQKKFGEDVNEILTALGSMKKEHHELTHLSETLASMNKQYLSLKEKLESESLKLHKKRVTGAKLLSKEVNSELEDLNMKGLRFLIEIEKLNEVQSTGFDRVLFRTQTGANDEARDLAKAASGGELSRILLSLKQVIGANQYPRTFLFDEVDTGVSGPTAEKVGLKLKNIASHQQVICVTHLPQVASFGDHHFYIEKHPTKGSVEMTVKLLKKAERVKEIARLISGEKVSKTSIAHARQLLGPRHL